MARYKTKDIVSIAIMAILIAACSWISIPSAVPFTMQTFGVYLAFYILGAGRGTLCISLYILLGLIGVPVFSNGTAGIGVLFGATGGYMIGWLISGLIMRLFELALGKGMRGRVIAMLTGMLVCYIIGTAWFMVVYAISSKPVGLWSALVWCVLPFIIPDAIKLGLAIWLGNKLKRILKI